MSGRTHRSAPTQCGKRSGDNGKRRGKRTFPQRGGTEPAPYRGSGAGRATAGYGHPALRVRHRWCTARADVGIGPYGKERTPHQPPGLAAQSGASAARMGGMGRERGRDHPPKGPSTPDNPSVTAKPCQLPLHKGAFGDGGCGLPRRPLRKAQSTTQASRHAAKRPSQRPRGMGGNRRKDHPKRGPPRDCRGSA